MILPLTCGASYRQQGEMQNDESRMQNRRTAGLRAVLFALLLGLGIWISYLLFGGPNWAVITFGILGPVRFSLLVILCGAVAWLPATGHLLDQLRVLSSRGRVWCSVGAGLVSTAYLWLTALAEHRQFFPYIHDEFSYLIQAHQLARGRLWMPAHPLGQFFDSFQLLVKPVYASAYFPGTALLYVPGVWLHVSPYITSLIVAGAVAGLLFWIITELIDALAGGLAVLLLWCDGMYRELSLLTLGQLPLLLFGLLAIVAWLRWHAKGRIRWEILTGLFLGLAAITRPVDALCFAVPIGIAVVVENWKQRWAVAIGALPLICLQLIANHGITGQWLRTPFGLYADRDYPGSGYGFHVYDPMAKPQSDLPQKIALYENEYRAALIQHRPVKIVAELLHPHGPFNGARLGWTLSQCSPDPFPLLLIFLPLSLLALNRKRAVLLATLPLFVLLYIPYVFFFPHYVVTAAPAVIVGSLLAGRAIAGGRRSVDAFLMLLIAGLAIAALPQWELWTEDPFRADLLASVNDQLAHLPHRPAVVLFTYDPKRNTHEEPVYNSDVAWPDDAEVIRAHDRGAENQAVFDYYALHQPSRFFYRFDERDRTLHALGTAAELGRK
jgi:hypothetical protein